MAKRVHQLTETSVQKAKPGKQRREIPDGGGLYLVVQPTTGQKGWCVRYRLNGQPKKLTLVGNYPSIDLKTARKLARKALQDVAGGGDPAAGKIRARRLAADRSTAFAAVVGEFLDRHLTRKKQRPRPRTIQQLAWFLGVKKVDDKWIPVKGGLADRWRAKKVSEITKADVLGILGASMARGVPVVANRQRAILRWFFSWCVRQDLCPLNPVVGIDQPAEEAARERFLSDVELVAFWRACGEERLYGPFWRLIALTGVRREEARGARWSEIETDAALWTIPAVRVKNGRTHAVPLSRPALELLGALPRISGKGGFIFTTTGENGLGGLSGAKARLDSRMLALLQKGNPKAELPRWTIHDLRRTVATGMAKLGVSLEVIERTLNHVSGSFAGIVAVYQHHDYSSEKRAALDAWARHIEAITTGATANVVEMRGRRS